MPIDHSKTYRVFKLSNIPHMIRKRSLSSLVKSISKDVKSYADFGCSNGYLTNHFTNLLSVKNSYGYDKSANIEIAKEKYKNTVFNYLDLNKESNISNKVEVVTCFETLEHVSNTKSAIKTLRSASLDNSIVLISVPIEIGFVGIIKYLLKRFVYKYPLPLNCTDFEYFKSLVTRGNINIYRPEAEGYGTHFGFDYRIIDQEVHEIFFDRKIKSWNSFTTRFYKISV